MPLRLIIEDDEGTTTIVPLANEAITIGRQQGNTIQLTEKNVSRRHARLFPEGDGWRIEDLGSYNGIRVNGQLVHGRVFLREGDVVQIGDYHLALTEDVNKRSLNFEGRDAANDADPLLASSSSELPRISPDELANLQSSRTPPAMPPLEPMVVAAPPRAARRGSLALLLGGGALFTLSAVAVIVWFSFGRDDGTSPDPDDDLLAASPVIGAEEADAAALTAAAAPMLAANPSEPEEVLPTAPDLGAPVEAEAEAQPVEPEPAEPEPAEPEEAEAPELGDDAGGRPERRPASAAERRPASPAAERDDPTDVRRRARTERRATKPPAAPSPDTPAKSAEEAEALLQEARTLQFRDPARAYTLAREAYGARRSQGALVVMASSACRSGDAESAQRASAKLRGDAKETVLGICRKAGIDV